METVKKYLSGAFLLLVFLSATVTLFSFCNANRHAYQVLRENLKNQFFEAEEGE